MNAKKYIKTKLSNNNFLLNHLTFKRKKPENLQAN